LPNKKSVFVNDSKDDIGKYTSPIKMFEYMACKRPFVASDLPVLKEVLVDGYNCLLAESSDIESWIKCINQIQNDESLSNYLIENSYQDVSNRYTWRIRAIKIQNFASIIND
jgi:glycosyltransferase involved in cell wall biosynthesis